MLSRIQMPEIRESTFDRIKTLSAFFCCFVVLVFLLGCSARQPVPLGTIPPPPRIGAADERQGQEALGELAQQYKLSRDDAQKERVEKLVARLAAASGASTNTPWHITLFEEPKIRNAAATRGNFLFVWSGLLDYLRTDEELAIVLSHELGHILAGHVMPDPADVANRAVAEIGGQLTGNVVASAARVGIAGDLAGLLAKLALEAMIVNPGQRRVETEADEIGIFLLARAGFDPDTAIHFWERVQNDPDFGSSTFAFLSTHPSGKDRFKHLQAIGEKARAVRQRAWVVKTPKAIIFEHSSRSSDFIEELNKEDYFFGNPELRGWICGTRGCVEAASLREIY